MDDIDGRIERIYRHCNSAQRPWAFLYLLRCCCSPSRNPRTFWRVVSEHWSAFDLIPYEEFEREFARYKRRWNPSFMSHESRLVFESIPASVRVFRGGNGESAVRGLSFSLNRRVAEGFAEGHRGIRYPDPRVFEMTVSRDEIAFVCNDRDELEVVLFNIPQGGCEQA